MAIHKDGRCNPIAHVWNREANAVMYMSATELLGMMDLELHYLIWLGFMHLPGNA